jgi:hypothetical protein
VRLKLLTSMALIGFAGAAAAQEAAKPAFEFALHGFVSGTVYMQDANTYVSPGQQVLSAGGAATATAPSATYATDKPVFGGDVRQTRLNFSVKGPQVLDGVTPKGVVEVDFFGAYQIAAGAPVSIVCTPGAADPTCPASGVKTIIPAAYGGSGEQSVIPRLRFAYLELDMGSSVFWVGQQNHLAFAAAPTSLTHIAFPLGYLTGNIGWRSPGIFGFHRFGDADLKHEFAWEIGAATWNFGAAATSGPFNAITSAGASGLPMVELRYTATAGKMFNAWVVGHWNQLDLNGPDVPKTSCDTGTACSTKQVIAGAAGLKLSMSGFTLQGAGWYGKNTGGLLGNLNQFTPATYVGDLFGWGAWGQVGFNFTPELSLWYMMGASAVVDWAYAEAQAIARLRNVDNVLMLQYREGGFGIGLEYVNFFTTVRASATSHDVTRANQYALTGNYYF